MKIHILSDIHLECFDMAVPEVDADITVIAGDLHNGTKGTRWLKKLGRPVIYIPGNHEYYGHEINKLRNEFKKQTHILDNSFIKIGDTLFFGSTLWTDFKYFPDIVFNMKHAKSNMNDFKFIRNGAFTLRPEDTTELHKEALEQLRRFDEINHYKKVIITHHLPSSHSVHPVYRQVALTAAFASNLDSIVFQSCAKLWIHGHTHESCDYRIGKTRVICNPRGYYPLTNENFNPGLVIDL